MRAYIATALLLAASVQTVNAAPNAQAAAALDTIKQARDNLMSAVYAPQGQVVLGNPTATATVAVFHDYRCGYCRSLSDALQEQLKTLPTLRVVVQQMAVLGEESMNAAIVALAAQRMNAGLAAHNILGHYNGQAWDVDTLVALVAKEAKLNAAELKKLATSSQVTDSLEATHQIGEALGITGTPVLFSVHERIGGAPPANALKAFLQKAAKP